MKIELLSRTLVRLVVVESGDIGVLVAVRRFLVAIVVIESGIRGFCIFLALINRLDKMLLGLIHGSTATLEASRCR